MTRTLALWLALCACKQEEAPRGAGSASGAPSARDAAVVVADAAARAFEAPSDASAAATPVTPVTPETAEQSVDVPFLDKAIPVKARVPVGWKRRDPIPTWDPPDANLLPMWHRSYEITATCDGGCTPAELGPRIPKLLDAIKARHIKPKMSGDPVEDERTVAPVRELERGVLPQGGMFQLLRVEKPVDAKGPYPDLFVGTCITRRETDDFFVMTRIAAAPDDEKTWWPVLVASCKATTVLGPAK